MQKEKGIIAQEINMMEDTPSWKTYVGVFEGMYHTRPVNTSIAGSVQSIAEITPEILFLCHKAFYSPANMSLIVSGNADFDRIVQMAESLSPKTAAKVAARQYGARQENVAAAEVTHYMSVSRPSFMLGIERPAACTGGKSSAPSTGWRLGSTDFMRQYCSALLYLCYQEAFGYTRI